MPRRRAGLPGITVFAAKGGNQGFNCTKPPETATYWGFHTPTRQGLSHLTLYDIASPAPIPLPAAGWLLVAGLGVIRRRRARAA